MLDEELKQHLAFAQRQLSVLLLGNVPNRASKPDRSPLVIVVNPALRVYPTLSPIP